MKVEKISPNKFKLTFSDEDLKDFGVDFENIRYNSQIVVEAVATKNDGLTMTITRVGDNGKKSPKIRNRKNKAEKHTDISPVIFSFDDFENLVQACKYIENIFVGISRLYKMDGEYYLVMDAIHESVAVSVDCVLHEYGEKILNSNIAEGKLCEYGELLIKNTAIANISANF